MLSTTIVSLREQIDACEAHLADLKSQFAHAEAQSRSNKQRSPTPPPNRPKPRWPLSNDEYRRYGRQMIIPQIGLQGQLRLKKASVLIVGVGGLGCPAAAYLAGAGVGKIGLVDGDTVDTSNLHRQIIHSTKRVGLSKVESGIAYLTSLNAHCEYVPHPFRLSADIALDLFRPYDLVLDCSDNPATRYLISDTCVLLEKPLVSASAVRTDGQLMVLNNPPAPPGSQSGGPCYRCVFPKPPPPESVLSCGEGGILGPVVGVMGVLQALEAIKLITSGLNQYSNANHVNPTNITKTATNRNSSRSVHEPPSLLLFSAYDNPQFRTVRLRPMRRANCAACSAHATITPDALNSGSLDYLQFCGAIDPINALTAEERSSADNYARLAAGLIETDTKHSTRHILVDVRDETQFGICKLVGSINIPITEITRTIVPTSRKTTTESPDTKAVNGEGAEDDWVQRLKVDDQPIFVVCRLGNDSQIAVKKMKELGLDLGGERWIGDIQGGLHSWREKVDPDFPEY